MEKDANNTRAPSLTSWYRRLMELKADGNHVSTKEMENLEQEIEKETDPTNTEYQIIQWKKLKEKIKTIVANCFEGNVKETVIELFKINLYRGKGLLVRYVSKAQLSKPIRTQVLASVISVLNSKLPEIGELLLSRLIVHFRKNYLRNRAKCKLSAIFLAHLVNQRVSSEIVILQIMQLLLENRTNDSLVLACEIMNHVGKYMEENSSLACNMVFDRLRQLLHEDKNLNRKAQGALESILKNRRNRFKNYPTIPKELDLVEFEEQETHMLELGASYDTQDSLCVFQVDPDYEVNEKKYEDFKKEILDDSDEEEDEENVSHHDEEENQDDVNLIKDMTQSNLLNHQKTVYLTMMSSMSPDEAVHKLLKLDFGTSGQNGKEHSHEIIADMLVKCCSQEKTYSKYHGVIGEKLCSRNKHWHRIFVQAFKNYYSSIYQYDTNALRNIGKFFGHLFALQVLLIEEAWPVILLTEQDTDPASRVFIKFLFQELVSELGVAKLQAILSDDIVRSLINGLLPSDPHSDPEHLRFSINYFTAIGLGVLTQDMRQLLPIASASWERSRASSPGSTGGLLRSLRSNLASSFSRSPSPEHV